MRLIHPGYRLRCDLAIADVAAVIIGGIGVEDFGEGAGLRNADPILLSDNRCKVKNDVQVFVIAFAAVTDDGLLHIVAIDPFKAEMIKIVRI